MECIFTLLKATASLFTFSTSGALVKRMNTLFENLGFHSRTTSQNVVVRRHFTVKMFLFCWNHTSSINYKNTKEKSSFILARGEVVSANLVNSINLTHNLKPNKIAAEILSLVFLLMSVCCHINSNSGIPTLLRLKAEEILVFPRQM